MKVLSPLRLSTNVIEDYAEISLECCLSGGGTFDEIEASKQGNEQENKQGALSKPNGTTGTNGTHGTINKNPVRLLPKPSGRRMSNLRKSLTRSLTLTTKSGTGSKTPPREFDPSTSGASGASAASSSEANGVSIEEAARLVASEVNASENVSGMGDVGDFSAMSFSSADEDLDQILNKFKTDDATDATACETPATYASTLSTVNSVKSQEDTIADMVGMNTKKYLEESFSTEVSILNREKFNAVPEYVRSDFKIMGCLGKGSFSDVFQVTITVPRYDHDIDSSRNSPQEFGAHLRIAPKDSIAPVAPIATPQPISRNGRRPPRNRRGSLASSCTTSTLQQPSRCDQRQLTLAMKCLRPQIRHDADQFIIGAEDLVHETAMLASLNHPNIIKLHGRAAGDVSNAFKLNDGYFILLDRLDTTLEDRIAEWKTVPRHERRVPSPEQMTVATSVVNAMAYLHSKNIVFRDLKPANVGFDSQGVLKLFDFGFAIGLPKVEGSGDQEPLLYDRCGTPRYMAPEVAFESGYSTPADVYSFGILLWEMCTLKKPFASFKSAAEFESHVYAEGNRPPIHHDWPEELKDVMASCWANIAVERPTMRELKKIISNLDLAPAVAVDGSKRFRDGGLRNSMMGRVSWNI